jgi:hypothetical protein
MLNFWLSWMPYGGPPYEEVITEFGMSVAQMERRLTALVRARLELRVPTDEQTPLTRVGLAAALSRLRECQPTSALRKHDPSNEKP